MSQPPNRPFPYNVGGVPIFMNPHSGLSMDEMRAIQNEDSGGHYFTKEDFISMGTAIWNLCVAHGIEPGKLDDVSVVEAVERGLRTGRVSPTLAFIQRMLAEPDGSITVVALAQWVDCGMPQIEMGHKFAAALLCSDVQKDALEMVRRPWRSFCIEVPDNLLHIYDNTLDKVVPIRRVLVTQIHNKHGDWAYIAWTTTAVTLWRMGVPAEQLLPPTLEGQTVDETFEQTDEDLRVNSLLGRLIINTCLTMTMGGMLTERKGPGHEAWKKHKENPARVKHIRSFQLGRPVVVDLRDKVRSFVSGERKSPDVRSLVRGHFKRQHFGQGNLQVKIIFREPYWRGDENLPIVSPRPHVIKADE